MRLKRVGMGVLQPVLGCFSFVPCISPMLLQTEDGAYFWSKIRLYMGYPTNDAWILPDVVETFNTSGILVCP